MHPSLVVPCQCSLYCNCTTIVQCPLFFGEENLFARMRQQRGLGRQRRWRVRQAKIGRKSLAATRQVGNGPRSSPTPCRVPRCCPPSRAPSSHLSCRISQWKPLPCLVLWCWPPRRDLCCAGSPVAVHSLKPLAPTFHIRYLWTMEDTFMRVISKQWGSSYWTRLFYGICIALMRSST
jgi:hypothetical protein